jgi:hypothetical protein
MVDEYMKTGKAERLRCPKIKKAFNMFHFCALNEYFNMCNKTNKCSCIKHVLSHIVNYKHVLTAFVITTRVLCKSTENAINCQIV